MKVLKFGGTSMANAETIKKVAKIINQDEKNNRFIVVSAPGKREKSDTKVTDLLYAAYKDIHVFPAIEKRFNELIAGLDLTLLNLSEEYNIIKANIEGGASAEYLASRGEYLSAKILAAYLGIEFIDAAELIKFDADGKFDAVQTQAAASKRLKKSVRAIIPGFYGKDTSGEIKTFSRGGSDISGAIIARAVSADIYENWTDVDGFMVCDPRTVPNAEIIDVLTYKELRELSYMGASVLHSESIFPVREADIPIHIRNTFNPAAKGTLIVPTKKYFDGLYARSSRTVTGIAGEKGFIALTLEKSMMNVEVGFAKRVLEVLEKHGISIEHMPTGIDTLTVIIDGEGIDKQLLFDVKKDLNSACSPNRYTVEQNLSMIAVVGHNMSRKTGTAARLFSALSKASVNIRMIDQGSSELNIIVGVEDNDYETAIRALYEEFKND
ncbi:MAG: aspartate kinase [Firmicutes bacterium]|nr:aspartate kinase [Bacillota bacterium]